MILTVHRRKQRYDRTFRSESIYRLLLSRVAREPVKLFVCDLNFLKQLFRRLISYAKCDSVLFIQDSLEMMTQYKQWFQFIVAIDLAL